MPMNFSAPKIKDAKDLARDTFDLQIHFFEESLSQLDQPPAILLSEASLDDMYLIFANMLDSGLAKSYSSLQELIDERCGFLVGSNHLGKTLQQTRFTEYVAGPSGDQVIPGTQRLTSKEITELALQTNTVKRYTPPEFRTQPHQYTLDTYLKNTSLNNYHDEVLVFTSFLNRMKIPIVYNNPVVPHINNRNMQVSDRLSNLLNRFYSLKDPCFVKRETCM